MSHKRKWCCFATCFNSFTQTTIKQKVSLTKSGLHYDCGQKWMQMFECSTAKLKPLIVSFTVPPKRTYLGPGKRPKKKQKGLDSTDKVGIESARIKTAVTRITGVEQKSQETAIYKDKLRFVQWDWSNKLWIEFRIQTPLSIFLNPICKEIRQKMGLALIRACSDNINSTCFQNTMKLIV